MFPTTMFSVTMLILFKKTLKPNVTFFNFNFVQLNTWSFVAQWIKRSACNHKVVGSNPGHPQKESLVVGIRPENASQSPQGDRPS